MKIMTQSDLLRHLSLFPSTLERMIVSDLRMTMGIGWILLMELEN